MKVIGESNPRPNCPREESLYFYSLRADFFAWTSGFNATVDQSRETCPDFKILTKEYANSDGITNISDPGF